MLHTMPDFYVEHMGGNTKGDKKAAGLHENGLQVSNASRVPVEVPGARICATTLPCRARAIVSSVQCSLVVYVPTCA